jgi:hypothetical protein
LFDVGFVIINFDGFVLSVRLRHVDSDEMNGHFSVMPLIYDLVAKTEEEKQRVYTIIDGLTEGIIKNDLYLVDPSTGQPTTWGFWNPSVVNGDPAHYSERGLNSLGILSYLASAYSVTRKPLFKDTFQKLVEQHGYVRNTMNVKIDNPDDDNHSDNELITLSYHCLFYSWRRISAEAEPAFKVRTPTTFFIIFVFVVVLLQLWIVAALFTIALFIMITCCKIHPLVRGGMFRALFSLKHIYCLCVRCCCCRPRRLRCGAW